MGEGRERNEDFADDLQGRERYRMRFAEEKEFVRVLLLHDD